MAAPRFVKDSHGGSFNRAPFRPVPEIHDPNCSLEDFSRWLLEPPSPDILASSKATLLGYELAGTFEDTRQFLEFEEQVKDNCIEILPVTLSSFANDPDRLSGLGVVSVLPTELDYQSGTGIVAPKLPVQMRALRNLVRSLNIQDETLRINEVSSLESSTGLPQRLESLEVILVAHFTRSPGYEHANTVEFRRVALESVQNFDAFSLKPSDGENETTNEILSLNWPQGIKSEAPHSNAIEGLAVDPYGATRSEFGVIDAEGANGTTAGIQRVGRTAKQEADSIDKKTQSLRLNAEQPELTREASRPPSRAWLVSKKRHHNRRPNTASANAGRSGNVIPPDHPGQRGFPHYTPYHKHTGPALHRRLASAREKIRLPAFSLKTPPAKSHGFSARNPANSHSTPPRLQAGRIDAPILNAGSNWQPLKIEKMRGIGRAAIISALIISMAILGFINADGYLANLSNRLTAFYQGTKWIEETAVLDRGRRKSEHDISSYFPAPKMVRTITIRTGKVPPEGGPF